jgi:hypothetical protein
MKRSWILAVIIAVTLLNACSLSGWLTYTNATYQFEFQYPGGGSIVSDSSTFARIDLPFNSGTNLVEKYMEVYADYGGLPCLSPYSLWFNSGNPPSEPSLTTQTLNGIYWVIESGSEGAAGSIYEWTAYSTAYPEGACVSLVFILHSHSGVSYETPPPAFDKAGESLVFPLIAATFKWLIPTPVPLGPIPVHSWTPSPVHSWTPTPAPFIYFVPKFNAYCRSGPDPIFGSIAFAMKGESYPVDGRNADNDWLYIMLSPAVGCWVPLDDGTASEDTERVRVLFEIPTPTFTREPVDCSQYVDIRSCEAEPACSWDKDQSACTHD